MAASSSPQPYRSLGQKPWCHVLLDFDGTIAPDDPTDRLLERFAEPAWLEIEAAWQSGKISARHCMARHTALLRVTPEALDQAIGEIRIDPGVHAFVDICRRRGVELTIVSDGFDRVLRAVLEREQLRLPFFANRLEWQGGDRWRLAFPYARVDCRSQGANCKCAHGVGGASPLVVIGDGRSDFCMSESADYVIAKGALAAFCRSRQLAHASFETFDEVRAHFMRWLDREAMPHVPLSAASLARRN